MVYASSGQITCFVEMWVINAAHGSDAAGGTDQTGTAPAGSDAGSGARPTATASGGGGAGPAAGDRHWLRPLARLLKHNRLNAIDI